jgi:hypothetical protein
MKIRPVGAEVFHADGRTDKHDEAFRNFAHASKMMVLAFKHASKFRVLPRSSDAILPTCLLSLLAATSLNSVPW